jgi:FKBP-type peptidyl-prolyl cis-trans isomerase
MNNSTKIIVSVIGVIILLGLVSAVTKSKPNSQVNQQFNINKSTTTNNMNPSQELEISTLKTGSGPEAKTGDTVVVHYHGTLEDGTVFDSSVNRGSPFSFTLGEGRVIAGWEQGVQGMKVGEKRRLVIPGKLAYGPTGYPGTPIGPNATLIFEIDLLEVK